MSVIRVALIEDDLALREGLAEYLRLAGFQVCAVGSGLDFFAALTCQPAFHVAVVDLGLPDVEGRRLVEHLRKHSSTRIVVLTASDARGIRIDSYEAGADLYMSKPVDPDELAAALLSVGGRSAPESEAPSVLPVPGDWQLHRHDWSLRSPQGKSLRLTGKDFQLLLQLASANGELVSREDLCRSLYRRHDVSAEAALSTQVRRLRQRLTRGGIDHGPIRTGHGSGYCFSAPIRIF